MNTKFFVLLTFITLAIAFPAMAQKKSPYDSAWNKVEAAMKKGLPKTALEEVNKIYELATAEKADAQLVKALVVKSELVQQTEENDWYKNVQAFEEEIKTASEPAKQILHSIAAELYWDYYQEKRYQLYNRTNTINFNNNDPETWTTADFHQRILQHYEASLANPGLLQQTKLTRYDAIITRGNQRKLRPTLYDLLAHKALEYFESGESDLDKPSYSFELNDMANLADAKVFLRYEYSSKDSNSHLLKTIQLYQDLIKFHLNDKDPAALVDVDIARIAFAYENSVNTAKEQLYKEALENIYNQYQNLPEAMQAGYLLAEWWQEKGNNYNPGAGTDEVKYALVQAHRIASEVARKFPGSQGGASATNMVRELEQPVVKLTVEKVNVIGDPFRALVQFKNTDAVNLRIVRVTDAVERLLNTNSYESDAYWQKLMLQRAIRTWEQPLPKTEDMREHSTEIKVDGLPVGKYILFASKNNDFNTGENAMAAADIFISNISYVNNGVDYFFLDRQTGNPLPNAAVQVWYNRYDYSARKNNDKKGPLLNTDKNGYVKLPEADNKNFQGNIKLETSYGKDKLFLNDAIYSNRYYNNTNAGADKNDWDLAKYFLFTDRSIYRPGQVLYFKAIGIVPHGKQDANEKGNSLFLPGKPVTVQLYNANNEVVDSLSLTPNDFGSINGQFKLPESGLTGTFRLQVKMKQYSATNIRVEAYKRPKFYADITKPTGSYKLNDTVHVTGKATAYAGNNIDGATVKYRVSRTTQFLYPWLFWQYGRTIWPPVNRETVEITHGETTTDANGKFEIDFTAIPDLSVNKTLDPSFNYTIEADITDINGETRSASNTVSVGDKSLLVNIYLPGGEQQHVDTFKTVTLSSTNLNGQNVSSTVALSLYKLKTPTRLIRERYWEMPDTAVMTYEEYVHLFPHDEYRNEADPHTWETGKKVVDKTVTIDSITKVNLGTQVLEAGWYKIEAITKDKDGNTVKAVEYVALSNPDKNQLPAPAYHVAETIQNTAEPGEKAIFLQGSSADDLFVIQQVIKAGKQVNDKAAQSLDFLQLNKSINNYEFPVTAAARGGFSIARFFVKDNRVYSVNWNVNVPWTNKALSISFETFRDKLLPGAEEQWKVKISGNNGDAVAAEMLASMYDASLDQFAPHRWQPLNIWQTNWFSNNWNGGSNFSQETGTNEVWQPGKYQSFDKQYDRLITVNRYGGISEALSGRMPGVNLMMESAMAAPPVAKGSGEVSNTEALNDVVVVGYGVSRKSNLTGSASVIKTEEINADSSAVEDEEENIPVQIRKNFNETAFFFPDLHTNKDGETTFSFTMPEALTQWKLQTLAHTKDLSTGMASKTVVTQKELMVQPNAPRFFRQGDSLAFSSKIVNMSASVQTGTATLQMLDALTMEPVDEKFGITKAAQPFSIEPGQSIAVNFPLVVPMNFTDAVTYRIVAKADNVSDGEEMALPVLTNRMLVTESFPINMHNTNSKAFTWEKLKQSSTDATLQNQSLTVEYTSNPTWYAVQALPFLMEYPYDCAEQTWNRFYANALAAKIANSTPKIKAIFEQWKSKDTAALLSNLQKNEELKAVLLEETPWVLQAKDEATQKKNIALLFDMVRMSSEAAKAINKLSDLQTSNGGFAWFKGGRDDRYITQYILSGIGHLQKLSALPASQTTALNKIVAQALPYLDARIEEDYDDLVKNKTDRKENNLSSIAVQYLYMRSFFPNNPVAEASTTAYAYYTSQAKQYWLSQSIYNQGMIALALNRMEDQVTAKKILQSLTENSITNEEFGMYWKALNTGGYYWWQAPIESQALLIEAYSEIENDADRINDLKTWLLKQKQTQNWRTTKATAEACYALLLQGDSWLNNEQSVSIQLGDLTIKPSATETGTGYFKQTIDGSAIKPAMGDIKVMINDKNNPNTKVSTSWGAVYWQYFQDFDKITTAETPLSIKKQLFIQRNSDNGPVITPVNDKDVLKIGDKVKVHIEIRSDRNLEYVHLKDMRASCFEPVNVLSSYKYQDGLGYYESTLDASTNFFISYLPKGTYVFEYDLLVSHTGNFTNGISSMQCMYAPEFSSHSEGIRVTVQ